MDPSLKAAELGEFSDESDELEHTPADILASVGPTHVPLSPTHSPGHVTPGHLVGRPIHDSPKQHHIEIHIDTPEPHLGGLHAKTLDSKGSVETLVEPVGRAPGSEPGVDVRRPAAKRAYAHIHENCEIEVIDYSTERIKFRQFNNDSFLDFLQTTDRTPPLKVRWINIGGLSWDVISGLAIKYQLHPLAIEDILHSRSTARSKADYYQRHLFLSVLTHAVSAKKQSLLSDKYLGDGEQSSSDSSSESSNTDEEQTDDGEEENRKTLLRRVTTRRRKRASKNVDIEMTPKRQESQASTLRWIDATMLLSPEGRRRQARIAKLNALKKRDRVRVIVSNAFFFLFKDGTVISIHSGDRAFGNPIYQRLLHADTVLRRDPEGSLLLESLLDLIVDQALQVVDKYSDKINESETQVLLKPNMDVVRSLHILSADLTMRKRAMEPLKSLIYGLRRFDVERTAACLGVSTSTTAVQGYMSPKTKVYLSDISDHLESILSSLDQFSTMTDNLIDFTFNMNAHSSNEQMKRMNILMCVFLPLTLLTGYFGMNFDPMPAVNKHSDILFWEIAIPVMAVILPWALWGDITKMFRYFSKHKLLEQVEKKQMAKVKSAKKAEMKRRRTLDLSEKTKR